MANIGETQTSSRSPNEVAANVKDRRGRSSQSSVSDSSKYITEAFGTPHDDEEEPASEGRRPLSFLHGLPHQEEVQLRKLNPLPGSDQATRDEPQSLTLGLHGDNGIFHNGQALNLPTMGSWGSLPDRNSSSPASPTPSLRDVQGDPSLSLASIDDPNDIAQELSNLQALRRLSMDVGNSIDPDMPLMPIGSIPSIAPRGDDDENDPSRLLWVPARVHPELAPSEFKSFLESRLQSIRRRSGDSFLTPNIDQGRSELGVPNSSLRRKKSMLSRQIDSSSGRAAADHGEDTDRPQRHLSNGSQHTTELSLDDLVRDPTKIVQKLTQESQGFSGGLERGGADMPILPIAPGAGLRRSTRTTYRKGGSLRSGDKGSYSRRTAQRQQDECSEHGASSGIEVSQGSTTQMFHSQFHAEDTSRHRRSVRRQQKFSQDSTNSSVADENNLESRPTSAELGHDQSSVGVSLAQQMASSFETPASEEVGDIQDLSYLIFPVERLLSDSIGQESECSSETLVDESSASLHSVGNHHREGPALNQQPVSKSYSNSRPHSANSGANPSSSDAYTAGPSQSVEERKAEKRSKKEKDDDTLSHSSKSGSTWKWFKGGVDDKDKKKEEGKKSKARSSNERTQDNVRLDLIQTSIDKTAIKGRESFVSDRESIDLKPHEERKKENTRKGDSKKDKDGSIFSSIFGGGKRKEEKEKHRKNQQYLQVPEDPPYKPLRPDVDYNWTRFPLLEERAIYRMAHIKLANPRRSLHSQVLLSNFMYSYLAIVQAMHPQMNVPISPQQKRLEEEARRKRELEEQQAQQEQQYLAQHDSMEDQSSEQLFDQYDYDYHRVATL